MLTYPNIFSEISQSLLARRRQHPDPGNLIFFLLPFFSDESVNSNSPFTLSKPQSAKAPDTSLSDPTWVTNGAGTLARDFKVLFLYLYFF